MAYSPRMIANAFLWKKGGGGLSHIKLQKLVFFLHAWSLALYGKPGASESPEAWQYGPVFSSLYHELKSYGSSNITQYLTEYSPSAQKMVAFVPNQQDLEFWSLFDRVDERYGRFSALDLSALTHEPGSPWEQAYRINQKEIPSDWIADYYRKKLTNSGTASLH